MVWEPRTLPRVTSETAPFWRGASDGRFLLRECHACGLAFFYPRAMCPDCLSADVDWTEAEGTGTIYAHTVSHRVKGWPEEDLPLVHAFVELDEGPRILTNVIECDPEDVTIGTRVQVTFEPTNEDDVAIPLFKST